MVENLLLAAPRKESRGMGLVSNILALVGFLLLAIVVAWGIYNIAKISNISLSGFSLSGFFSATPQINITTSDDAMSGKPLTISWSNSSAKSGSYAFLYQCSDTISFGIPGPRESFSNIPCGTSVAVGSSTSATMVPVSRATATTAVPFSVIFTSKTGERVEATAKVEIAPLAHASVSTAVAVNPPAQKTPVHAMTPAPSPVQHPAPKGNGPLVSHAASGPADLAVTIIATGYIDPASGALLMNRAPRPGDTIGVEFDIANVGGSATGAWFFQAHLPTTAAYTYTSDTQISLAPGAHIVNTLRFTDLAPGGGIFTVIADPLYLIGDSNHDNNEAATTIR